MKSVLFLGYVVTLIHAAINPIFSFLFSKLVMGILDPNAPKVTMWAMLVLMCAFLDGSVSAGKILLNIAAEGWQLDIREWITDKILDYKGSKIGHEYVSYYSNLLVNDTEKCCEVLTLYLPALLSMFILVARISTSHPESSDKLMFRGHTKEIIKRLFTP